MFLIDQTDPAISVSHLFLFPNSIFSAAKQGFTWFCLIPISISLELNSFSQSLPDQCSTYVCEELLILFSKASSGGIILSVLFRIECIMCIILVWIDQSLLFLSNFYFSVIAITYVFHFTDVVTLKINSSLKDPNDCLATVRGGEDTPLDFLHNFYGMC